MATIRATLTITPAHPALAAEVSGVDLTRPLDGVTFERIATAFDDYSVLVFRGQALTDEQQMAFSEHWGPLETTVRTLGGEDRLGAHIVDLSNTDADGKLMGWEDRRMLYQSGNQLWHSDSSFNRCPRTPPRSPRGWCRRRAATPSSRACASRTSASMKTCVSTNTYAATWIGSSSCTASGSRAA
jgi:hypothetical protein